MTVCDICGELAMDTLTICQFCRDYMERDYDPEPNLVEEDDDCLDHEPEYILFR